jgi:hypothetical protein
MTFPSCNWISVFILVLLGYFAIIADVYAQVSMDCSHQKFSLVDCPSSSSEREGSYVDENDKDAGNIEEQIPSVIPFP